MSGMGPAHLLSHLGVTRAAPRPPHIPRSLLSLLPKLLAGSPASSCSVVGKAGGQIHTGVGRIHTYGGWIYTILVFPGHSR